MTFIDRTEECAALARFAARPRPALSLVYGRRRVGKTHLLDHAFREHRLFYYLATDATAALNRRELLRELALWSGRQLYPTDCPSWRTVFRLLVDLAAESPLVVALDDFQYLLNRPEDDIASQLVAVWDREARDRPLILALSGSEIGTMAHPAAGSQPLYGRFDYHARLRPFDYRDARAMLPGRPPREAAYFYGALGSTPRYLAAVGADESFGAAITRVMGEADLRATLATCPSNNSGDIPSPAWSLRSGTTWICRTSPADRSSAR